MRRMSVFGILLMLLCIAGVSAQYRPSPEKVDQERMPETPAMSFNVQNFEPTRDAVVATGSVLVHQYFDLTDAEVSELETETPDFFNTLALDGMERVGNRIQRTFPVKDVTLRLNEEEVVMASDRFAFVAPKAVAREERARVARLHQLEVVVLGHTVAPEEMEVVVRNSANRRADEPLILDVILSANMREAAPMCHLDGDRRGGDNRKVGTHAGEPMGGVCLDYNGRYSDGINHSNKSAKGVRNFIGSDCFMAMDRGYCWTELVTKKLCYDTHKGKICSALIGHSSKYHKH